MLIYPPYYCALGEGSGEHEIRCQPSVEELRRELLRAEIAGELPEFHALNFQAILAMAERSELAGDYLEMAEAVAATPHERSIVAENRATYDLLQGDPLAAARRCLTTLEHVCQTEGLWKNLLVALCCLGDMDTIDAMLRRFAEMDDAITTRLVESLAAQPVLRDVQARPSFRALLARHRPDTAIDSVS
jgi:hypothetical protein